MQLFSEAQASAWVGRWLPVEALFDAPGLPRREFLAPDGAAPVHAVLRPWVSWLIVDQASLLVWVYEYGVWASSEDWNLYYRWRRAAGDSGVIADTPGHLFLAHEAPDAVSLLLMARLFGWGFRAVSRDWQRAVQIDHDGHGIVTAADDANLVSSPAAWG